LARLSTLARRLELSNDVRRLRDVLEEIGSLEAGIELLSHVLPQKADSSVSPAPQT
jgi:hypothetical protein